jgi:hypothetical protein
MGFNEVAPDIGECCCRTADVPEFEPRSGHVGFVLDKVVLGQVFSEYFGFPCQSSFHRLLHTHHLSSGAGTIGQTIVTVPSELTHPTRNTKIIRNSKSLVLMWYKIFPNYWAVRIIGISFHKEWHYYRVCLLIPNRYRTCAVSLEQLIATRNIEMGEVLDPVKVMVKLSLCLTN